VSKPRKIGPYKVNDELGRGGMGVVYKGAHELITRDVAIKELTNDIVKKGEEYLLRFKREAMALAGFRHQNIVTLYDFIEKDSGYYMVMELVDGTTLQDLLKEGPLPPDIVAVIGSQMASALEHAHFARIVHRDIKPANIMLSKTGDVKLMDFGIALDEQLEKLTKAGMAVGTPTYMSPEQVGGEPVDSRSDVYSLGVVLYECLSGLKPFTGPNAGEVFAKIRSGKHPALGKVAPRAPAQLKQVVRRAMMRKPKDRYADVSELKRAIDRYLTNHLEMAPGALLVAFLKSRGKISEVEALSRLTRTEMDRAEKVSMKPQGSPERGGMSKVWWLAVGALLAAAAWFTHSAWMPGIKGLLK
jgi:eukaryotic-like serine/threonine-protein kinase